MPVELLSTSDVKELRAKNAAGRIAWKKWKDCEAKIASTASKIESDKAKIAKIEEDAVIAGKDPDTAPLVAAMQNDERNLNAMRRALPALKEQADSAADAACGPIMDMTHQLRGKFSKETRANVEEMFSKVGVALRELGETLGKKFAIPFVSGLEQYAGAIKFDEWRNEEGRPLGMKYILEIINVETLPADGSILTNRKKCGSPWDYSDQPDFDEAERVLSLYLSEFKETEKE